ncbi:YqhR family membrane protein [Paenibacillus endoradicis]|uniref:YqhR family membrane protein n=1 Tax=Paenibacillus endoradicis TaxID=2972487 RepID=UPI00215908AE|nr:YqhR family membrane protein [Paenibacillus endoradicis]MCR8659273.1 YqhR family membrane protein [Paenibacillus endoradicis]
MNTIFQNFKRTGVTKPLAYALYIGFFAGLFWSCIRMISYYCNFTSEPVSFLIRNWLSNEQITSGFGQTLGSLSFIAFSIVASLMYMWFFRNLIGPWPGLWYGLGWWGILFGLGPLFGFTHIQTGVGFTLALTDLCLFVVWGLFIGYSIAFEFTDEASREPAKAS